MTCISSDPVGPWWLTVTVFPVITDNSLAEKRKVLTAAAGLRLLGKQCTVIYNIYRVHRSWKPIKNLPYLWRQKSFSPPLMESMKFTFTFSGKVRFFVRDSSKWPVAVKMKNRALKNTLPFQSHIWVLSILTNQTFLILNHFVFVVRFPLSVSLYGKCNKNTAGIILVAGSWLMAPL